MAPLILALNAGSSSIKFGAFVVNGAVAEPVALGSIDADPDSRDIFDQIDAKLGDRRPDAIGHRIVHGGPALFQPTRIDAAVIGQLEHARAFAPLHAPAALALIASAQRHYPGTPAIACFDTGFHQQLPPVAAVLPVPKILRAAGVRRYGFHGLSCQSIVRQLGTSLPDRLVIAHLGSGASVTAVHRGKSVDTSMGLTPSGGVVMATRSGDIDPGLLMYLLRERQMTAADLEELIDRHSGLRGISDTSGDMRALRKIAAIDQDAQLAIAIFCRSVAKQIAAMITSLGGIDLLVFSGGIGEHDAETRGEICADLAWAGIARSDHIGAAVSVKILSPDEEQQIALEVAPLLDSA